ncbi:hypothetical protein PMIN05_012584 [Paraphaeosphaeria minitans]
MRGHLRQEHKLYVPNVAEERRQLWYSEQVKGADCQQFFPSVPPPFRNLRLTRKFAVELSTNSHSSEATTDGVENPTEPSAVPIPISAPTSSKFADQLREASQWAKKAKQEQLAAIPSTPSVSTNPWVAHTGVLQVFSNTSTWAEALRYVAVPTAAGDLKLHYLYVTVKSMARTWQNVASKASRYARIRVMQEHKTDVPLTPLEPYQDPRLRHAGPLQKIFVFFYHVLVDNMEKPPTLHLQPHQEQTWRDITEYLDSTDNIPEVQEHHTRTQFTLFEEHCHRFWLSLIEQTSRTEHFELALLTPVAFLTLSHDGKGFREAYNFATDISAIKKFCRFAGLQKLQDDLVHSNDVQPQATTNSMQTAVSLDEASLLIAEQDSNMSVEAENRNLADTFKAWVYNYLTTEYPTSMSWLINTARFISKFRYGENLDAFVHWNGDTVTVRNIRTTLASFATMAGNEYEETSKILCQLTFVSARSDLPNIPWELLVEEPKNVTPGFSVFGPDNSNLVHGADFVVENLIKGVGQESFLTTPLTNLRDFTQVQRYCNLVQKFLKHLLCLIHFTSGQPGRGTEVLSVQLENSHATGMRNIFLYNGLVAVVPRYHKGYNRDKTVKTIYRFLPAEVGSLLVWYIWLVRPFYLVVQGQIGTDLRNHHYEQAQSVLLWPDAAGKQHTTSHVLGSAIQSASLRWIGQEINISTLRHLMIAFARRFASSEMLVQELTKEDVDDITNEVEAEAQEMQAGHLPETAHAVYALDVSKIFTRSFNNAEAHFKTSQKWHRAIHFGSVEAQPSLDCRKSIMATTQQQNTERSNINLLQLLQENFGCDAQFRGMQKAALSAILTGESPAVQATGRAL